MSSGSYAKILFLLFTFSLSFSVQAKKKKKNQAAAVKVVETRTVLKKDSTTSSIKSPPPVAKKQEILKPFAQLVVSFTSIGTGIDSKARNQFIEHITWFNEQNKCELMYDKKTWGREGEIDYCFYGNNQILIPGLYKQLKEKFAGNQTVFINQNFPCK